MFEVKSIEKGSTFNGLKFGEIYRFHFEDKIKQLKIQIVICFDGRLFFTTTYFSKNSIITQDSTIFSVVKDIDGKFYDSIPNKIIDRIGIEECKNISNFIEKYCENIEFM